MGWIKRILNQGTRVAQRYNVQERAQNIVVSPHEQTGNVYKRVAPRYPTEERRIAENEQLSREAAEQNEAQNPVVGDRVDKHISIRVSAGDVELIPTTSSAAARLTHESEMQRFLRKIDDSDKYGIYEPPIDNVRHGRLTFGELMELLAAQMELTLDEENKEAESLLIDHRAVGRVDPKRLDNIYEFFSTFQREGGMRVDMDCFAEGRHERRAIYEATGVHLTQAEHMEFLYHKTWGTRHLDRLDDSKYREMEDKWDRIDKDKEALKEEIATEGKLLEGNKQPPSTIEETARNHAKTFDAETEEVSEEERRLRRQRMRQQFEQQLKAGSDKSAS